MTAPKSSRVARVLAARAGKPSAAPGDALDVIPDRLLMDGEGGLALADAFHRTTKRVREGLGARVIMLDSSRLGRRERPGLLEFASGMGATIALDPVLSGWPSQVAVEEGLVSADDVVCALDPEAGALGGLGTVVLATAPDVAASLLRRRSMPVTVPNTARVAINGRLPRWLGPFELALSVIDALGGRESARGRVIELSGEAISALPVDDRMTLCGVLARAGISALVPPDVATRTWLAARHPGGTGDDVVSHLTDSAEADAESGDVDQDARLDAEVDASKLTPAALYAPWPGDPIDPTGEETSSIQQVILGGRLSELRLAAHALAERPLHPGLHLVVIPASRRVLVQAMEEGLITAFVRSGAAIMPPGFAPPNAPKRERRVTNVPTGANDLLAGAAVVGASALAGRLVDPETVRREQRRAASIR